MKSGVRFGDLVLDEDGPRPIGPATRPHASPTIYPHVWVHNECNVRCPWHGRHLEAMARLLRARIEEA